MAYPSVTYTFSNDTIADASEVNTNFTNILSGFSDGTKDLNMNIATFAGAVTFNANVTIGNNVSDDLTITSRLASDLIPKTTNAYDLGSSSLYYAEGYINKLYVGGMSSHALTITQADNTSQVALIRTGTLTGGVRMVTVSGGLVFGTGYDTSMSGGATAMTIDSSRNVMIGTSSPQRPLHVEAGSAILRLSDSNSSSIGGATAYIEGYDRNDSNRLGLLGWTGGGNEDLYLTNDGSGDIILHNNGQSRMTIDDSGKTKIGFPSGSSSDHTLTLIENAATCGLALVRFGNLTGGVGLTTSDGELYIGTGYDTDMSGGATAMTIDSSGNVGIGRDPTYALDVYRASGQVLGSMTSASMSSGEWTGFSAVAKKSGGTDRYAGVFVVYYDQSSNGGSNETCGMLSLQAGDGAYNRYWADNSNQLRTSTTLTHVGSTNGTVVGTQTSDIRTKENIAPLPYGLNTVLGLNPVEFDQFGFHKLGFVAQDTQSIIPEAVYDTKEDIFNDPSNTKLGMEYVQIIPVLTKAIQELNEINNSQQSLIESLEARLEALEGK